MSRVIGWLTHTPVDTVASGGLGESVALADAGAVGVTLGDGAGVVDSDGAAD
jgi:hypothetical protein